MIIIFVGDKPSPRMTPGAMPFEGAACAKRLKGWIAFVTYGIDMHGVKIVNQCNTSYGWFFEQWEAGNKIVTLGKEAASRFKGAHELPHFELPHPSGRNRLLNDKTYVDEQLRLCKAWLQEGL